MKQTYKKDRVMNVMPKGFVHFHLFLFILIPYKSSVNPNPQASYDLKLIIKTPDTSGIIKSITSSKHFYIEKTIIKRKINMTDSTVVVVPSSDVDISKGTMKISSMRARSRAADANTASPR